MREGAEDYLALMVPGLFVTSLVLVAFTGSPKFLLAGESLAPPWSKRPMTFYTDGRCSPAAARRRCSAGTPSPSGRRRSSPRSGCSRSCGASG